MAGEWWEACSLLVSEVWSLLVVVNFSSGLGGAGSRSSWRPTKHFSRPNFFLLWEGFRWLGSGGRHVPCLSPEFGACWWGLIFSSEGLGAGSRSSWPLTRPFSQPKFFLLWEGFRWLGSGRRHVPCLSSEFGACWLGLIFHWDLEALALGALAANQALFSAKIFLALGRFPMAGEWWEACPLLVWGVRSLLMGVEFFIGEARRRLSELWRPTKHFFQPKFFFLSFLF